MNNNRRKSIQSIIDDMADVVVDLEKYKETLEQNATTCQDIAGEIIELGEEAITKQPLATANSILETLVDRITDINDEEGDSRDNMPENSERYEISENASDKMEDALSDLDDAKEKYNEVLGYTDLDPDKTNEPASFVQDMIDSIQEAQEYLEQAKE